MRCMHIISVIEKERQPIGILSNNFPRWEKDIKPNLRISTNLIKAQDIHIYITYMLDTV